MKEEFYLVLPSNSCPSTQPNNTANNFTVDYPNNFKFEGHNWEVGLSEFSCLYSHADTLGEVVLKYTVRGDIMFPVVMFYRNKELRVSVSNDKITLKLNEKKQLVIEYGAPFYIRFDSVKTAIKCGFENKVEVAIGGKLTAIASLPDNMEVDIDIFVIHAGVEKEYTMIFNEGMVFNHINDLAEYFQTHCKRIFVDFSIARNLKVELQMEIDIKEITLDSKLKKLLGFNVAKIINDKNQKIQADDKPNIKSTYDSFYIYSNIVDPIYVGDALVPLLRNIWLENKRDSEYGDLIYHSFDRPMYLPVSSIVINKIEINIRADCGKLINFIPNSKTSVTLHFRKNV